MSIPQDFKLNVLIWAFVLSTVNILADETVPQKYICYRTEKPIIINGLFDEQVWKKLPAMKNWTLLGKYTSPKYPTVARMCWDDTNLYVGFECIDEDIFGKKARRDDSVFMDDAFEIYIDPDGNGKNYIEIEVNPVNTIFDLLILTATPRNAMPKFNVEELQTAVRSYGTLNFKYDNDEKWIGEIAIPFASLANPDTVSLPPKDEDIWRIQLYRSERGKNVRADGEWSAWSPTRDTHVPEEFGYVTFSKKSP